MGLGFSTKVTTEDGYFVLNWVRKERPPER